MSPCLSTECSIKHFSEKTAITETEAATVVPETLVVMIRITSFIAGNSMSSCFSSSSGSRLSSNASRSSGCHCNITCSSR